MLGILYIVATPIGNLDDISFRAIETLKKVDRIACEDTRHTQRLLERYDITTPLFSYHEHNEQKSAEKIVSYLRDGKSIALVSDAGTPLISDPGYDIVKKAYEEKFKVVPLPGACAAITALSVSGLPSDRFSFEGFLPPKTLARQHVLEKLKTETRTLIFYEAPHRINDMLEDLKIIFGDEREIMIARELTKTFEALQKSTLKNLALPEPKGEFVVIVSGIPAEELEKINVLKAQELIKILIVDLPLKKSVHIAADIFNASKNTLYDWALTLKR